MDRKRREYFDAGVSLLWIVDPERRAVTVFTSAHESKEYSQEQALDGSGVLPGLRIELAALFGELDRSGHH